MKKIVIWGTGLKAENCILCLDDCVCDVIAFIESAPTKTQFYNINVFAPEKLIELNYDYLFIASQYITEIKEKLIKCHICLDNVINWLDFKEHAENYPTEIGEIFSDDFLKGWVKGWLLCKQWNEKEFETYKKMYRKQYENIIQKKYIYVYNLRIQDFKLAVTRLINILVNQGIKEDIGLLFIPDEKELDTVWYHNLLLQMDCYCFVLWEDMRSFYRGCRQEFKDKFIFDQEGMLLTKSIFSRSTLLSRYMDFKYCFEPSKLQQRIDQAERIDFYWFHSTRIGEAMKQLLWLKNRPVQEHELTVLIPSEYGDTVTLGTNACLTELISREFCMIRDESELWFWVKAIFRNPLKCTYHKYSEYFEGGNIFRVEGKKNVAVIDFLQDELSLGEKLIEQKLNLHKSKYVCICVRDSKYVASAVGAGHDVGYEYRNYDQSWGLFKKSCEVLSAQGLGTVRMGQIMKPLQESSCCIDFPNQGYDEYMDLMLHRYCKYVLGTDSGISQIAPWLFGKPVAIIWTGYPMLDEYANYKSEDLAIFCRFKDLKEGRELSLFESMKKCHEWLVEYGGDPSWFMKNEFFTILPDAEEICNMAIEMNDRLDGKWHEEDKDQELRDIFYGFVDELYKDTRLELYAYPTIATTFLRAHQEELLNWRNLI